MPPNLGLDDLKIWDGQTPSPTPRTRLGCSFPNT